VGKEEWKRTGITHLQNDPSWLAGIDVLHVFDRDVEMLKICDG